MIKQFISKKVEPIKALLSDYLNCQLQETTAIPIDCQQFLKEFVVGGKMYRAGLVYLGYELFANETKLSVKQKQKNQTYLQNMAMTVELIHSALVLHDDVMDQDQLRRAKPTFHVEAANRIHSVRLSDSKRVGESLAICLGDQLFFWGGQLISQASVNYQNHKVSSRILDHYHQMLVKTVWGQMDDVYLAAYNGQVSLDQILILHSFKSGYYSVVNPLVMGAMVARASAKQIQLLIQVAVNLGIIFQIKDDQMNLFGDEKLIGKPVGSDIREDKKTIVRHLLFESANEAERAMLRGLFGKATLSQQEVKQVQEIAYHCQVPDQIDQMTNSLLADVKAPMSLLKKQVTQPKLLESFVELMIQRKK